MSIAQLMTDHVKPYLNLNINTIGSGLLSIDYGNYVQDHSISTQATVTTQSGTVRFTNVSNIASGTATTVGVLLAGFETTDLVQITTLHQGVPIQARLHASLFSKGNGIFQVAIRNVSGLLFDGNSYAFDYIVSKPTS